jgi:PST family polysaccharide transporter
MQRVKQTYQKYQVMIHNFSYLTILKGLTLILPLITFPYLIQTLGTEKYGLVMWAWAIAQIFIVLIKFGFDTLGVKLVSENRDDNQKVSQIFSQITYVKLGLLLFNIIVFAILLFTIDKIFENQNLFIYFFVFVVFESMLPIWYFQGIENMKVMAILVSSVKLIFALLVFVVIKESSQYLYIPILYAIGSFVSNLIAYYIIFYKNNISLISIKVKDTYSMIKESFFILFATIGTVIRDRITIILIEKYLGLEMVAYFDLAMRIVNILLTPFHMVSQVLYPHIARTKDMLLLKKVLITVLLISFCVVGIFIYNLEWIVTMINGEVNNTLVDIMSILIFIVPVGIISAFVGTNIIVVFQQTKCLSIAIFFATLSYIIGFYSYAMNNKITIYIFIYIFLLFFIIEMFILLIKSKRILKEIKAKIE